VPAALIQARDTRARKLPYQVDFTASHIHPVPRDFDPPGTAGYLAFPAGDPGHGLDLPDSEMFPGDEISLDEDTLTVLDQLREVFGGWAISYFLQLRSWIARRRGAITICQNSAVLLCIALTLIERKERQARNNPRQDP
jgi:hypothetical protein